MEIKTLTNGDYNRIQINSTVDMDNQDRIVRKGLMLNIREDSVEKAYKLYEELKSKIEGREEKSKKKAKKDKVEKKPEGIETPTCECGNPMVLKNGKWGSFWSCSAYPLCRLTKPYQNKKSEEVPCDEDRIPIEAIPF